MTDDMNKAVRYLIKTALGLDGTTVRPANQAAPKGDQTAAFVTVNITGLQDLATPGSRFEAVEGEEEDDEPQLSEVSEMAKAFNASVNFYKTAAVVDGAGLSKASTAGFSAAATLVQKLMMSSNADLMRRLGLGLIDWSDPRNLTALEGRNCESRGQVDLTFNVVHRETAFVQTIDPESLLVVGIKFQPPGGPIRTVNVNIETEDTP